MNILSLFILVALKVSSASELRHEFIPFSGQNKVEIFWSAPAGIGPFPVYIYAHPFQGRLTKGAAPYAESGLLQGLANMGLVGVVFSQAGHGRSSGPADNCGKLSQDGLKAVIGYIKKLPMVDQKKIVLHGFSMGANLTALVASEAHDLAGVILEGASYDLEGMMTRIWAQGFQRPYLRTFYQVLNDFSGDSPDRFIRRSVMPVAGRIKSPVLILSGAGDTTSLPEEAVRFHELLIQAGTESHLVIYPFARHGIEISVKAPDIHRFLKDRLGVSRNYVLIK